MNAVYNSITAIVLFGLSQLTFATTVLIKTTQGEIKVELFDKDAPISSKNFIQYAESGFYKGTIFHRVIPGFMIQAGGFTKDMQEKPARPPIQNEANNGLKNQRGTLAMARTHIIDSATSQFFINLKDNTPLDHNTRDYGYAVFGKVIEGMEIVDKISTTSTTNKGNHANVPKQPIIILDMKVIKMK